VSSFEFGKADFDVEIWRKQIDCELERRRTWNLRLRSVWEINHVCEEGSDVSAP
jgi:hypothetical protein